MENAVRPIILIFSFFYQLPIYVMAYLAFTQIFGNSSHQFAKVANLLADKSSVSFLYSTLFVLLSAYMIFSPSNEEIKTEKDKGGRPKKKSRIKKTLQGLISFWHSITENDLALRKSFLVTIFLSIALIFIVIFIGADSLGITSVQERESIVSLIMKYVSNLLVLWFLGHGLNFVPGSNLTKKK